MGLSTALQCTYDGKFLPGMKPVAGQLVPFFQIVYFYSKLPGYGIQGITFPNLVAELVAGYWSAVKGG